MTDVDPRPALAAGLKADQQEWRELVAEVGDRLDEPGPMGAWTFRDLAAHIMGWRERTIRRLDAVADGQPDPPDPWPAGMDDDDAINDWYQAQAAGRETADILAEMDASHDRLAAALARIRRGHRLGQPLPRGTRADGPGLAGRPRLTAPVGLHSIDDRDRRTDPAVAGSRHRPHLPPLHRRGVV